MIKDEFIFKFVTNFDSTANIYSNDDMDSIASDLKYQHLLKGEKIKYFELCEMKFYG